MAERGVERVEVPLEPSMWWVLLGSGEPRMEGAVNAAARMRVSFIVWSGGEEV